MEGRPPQAPPALARRRAGVLLHATSLPGPGPQGRIGAAAHHFLDWLAAGGFTVWQLLPLGPVHGDGSPYQALSSHAGEPALVSAGTAGEEGLGPPADDSVTVDGEWAEEALARFEAEAPETLRAARAAFERAARGWLEDWALFAALREAHGGAPWWEWPAPLRDREPRALRAARRAHARALARHRHVQFVFERQWQALRAAARARGILLFGDLPLFVALDSADVWAHRALFALDAEGRPTRVAGVPPDYFSETGQLWGNPLYEWEAHERERFRWWVERLRTQLARFDLVRIDHFRGLEACWEIPAGARTAMEGRWVPAPGARLLERLRRALGGLPLVAEDLGVITPEVEALRERFGLPGMRVLQFAFGGDAANPHLPHNHVPHAVVYTGTHDNDTTVGWHATLDAGARAHLEAYLGGAAGEMPWPLVRMALASVARLAVIPMQDALGLGGEARMNRPGRAEGNWRWRFQWEQVPPDLAARLRGLLGLYGRLA